jgi:hypothetical protein
MMQNPIPFNPRIPGVQWLLALVLMVSSYPAAASGMSLDLDALYAYPSLIGTKPTEQ